MPSEPDLYRGKESSGTWSASHRQEVHIALPLVNISDISITAGYKPCFQNCTASLIPSISAWWCDNWHKELYIPWSEFIPRRIIERLRILNILRRFSLFSVPNRHKAGDFESKLDFIPCRYERRARYHNHVECRFVERPFKQLGIRETRCLILKTAAPTSK